MINTDIVNYTEADDLIDYRLQYINAKQYYAYQFIAAVCIAAAILNILFTFTLLNDCFGESKCWHNLFKIWFGILIVEVIILKFIFFLKDYTHVKCNLVKLQSEMFKQQFQLNSDDEEENKFMKCIIEGNIERALNNSNILKKLLVKQLQTYFDATDVYHDETHYSVVNTHDNVSSQTECILEELTIDNNCNYLTVQDDGSVISKKMHNNVMHCRLKFADSVYIIRCTKSLDEDATEHEYDVVSVVPSPEQDEPDEEYEAGSVTIKDSDTNEILEAIKSLK